MPDNEILEKIRDTLEGVKTDVAVIKSKLNGNGAKGMCQRLNDLETTIDNLESAFEADINKRRGAAQLWMFGTAIFSSLFGGGIVFTLLQYMHN